MNQQQHDKQIENKIKAFVFSWYSRFDNGTSMEEIKPFLPDETVEFVYPAATLNSVSELVSYAGQTFASVQTSAHDIDEIHVFKTAQDAYEVICPHTYHAQQADGSVVQMDFIGRMRLQFGLSTKIDPSGQLIKVVAYKVALQGSPCPSSIDKITAAKLSNFSYTDAQAFVHTWFSLIDGGDADQLMTMTCDGPLDIDILGNKITDKATLKGFLTAQGDSQNFSLHTPFNIRVTKNDAGFAVRFVLNFHGDVKETGLLTLSNVTDWTLIEQDGQLRLRDYTLEIL